MIILEYSYVAWGYVTMAALLLLLGAGSGLVYLISEIKKHSSNHPDWYQRYRKTK